MVMVNGVETGPSGKTLRNKRSRARREARRAAGIERPVTAEDFARDRTEQAREHYKATQRDGVPFR